MDIAALSMAMAQSKVLTQFGTEMLSMTLEDATDTGAELTQMMELSVNPNIGANFDVSV